MAAHGHTREPCHLARWRGRRSAAVVGARSLFGGRAEVLAPVSRRARLERAAATRRPAHGNDRVDDARRGAGANDPEGRGEPNPPILRCDFFSLIFLRRWLEILRK